jgi:hypothetical protein
MKMLGLLIALKMDVANISETSVNFYRTAGRNKASDVLLRKHVFRPLVFLCASISRVVRTSAWYLGDPLFESWAGDYLL